MGPRSVCFFVFRLKKKWSETKCCTLSRFSNDYSHLSENKIHSKTRGEKWALRGEKQLESDLRKLIFFFEVHQHNFRSRRTKNKREKRERESSPCSPLLACALLLCKGSMSPLSSATGNATAAEEEVSRGGASLFECQSSRHFSFADRGDLLQWAFGRLAVACGPSAPS